MSANHHHRGSVGQDHGHGHNHAASERAVAAAAALTGVFFVVEVVGGLVSGSLALLADAGHMLTDVASLTLAWLGFRLARRPADDKRTYGFDRFSVLAAFVNGIALFAIAGWIVVEAIRRLAQPPEVLGGLMLAVAGAGLAVNLATFALLIRGERDNLNIRAAVLHVLGDLLGSLAAMAASVIIIFTGWTQADPLLSVLVAVIILRAAWRVVADSGHILMEAAPRGMETADVAERLMAIEGVDGIGHVHLWAIAEERRMATLEAWVSPAADAASVSDEIKRVLRDEFAVGHATVEIRAGAWADREPRTAACCG